MKFLSTCFLMVLMLASCSKFADAIATPLKIKTLEVFSDAGINNDFPIPTDVVVVKNDELIEIIAEMEASTWFEQKPYFLPSNAVNLEVFEYELLPGSKTSSIKFSWSERRDAEAVFVISNLVEAVNSKARVDHLKLPVLILTDEGLELKKIKK